MKTRLPLTRALTRCVAILLLTLSVLPASASERALGPELKRLSHDQVTSDVALARETYERIHPGYDRYTSEENLNAGWENILDQSKTNGGLTVGELYLALTRILVEIRCDHTKAELPKSLARDRNVTPVYLPFHWDVIEGRAFIRKAAENLPVATGDELLAIDGRPVAEIFEEIRPFIPVDGYTDFVRDLSLSYSNELMGGAVDHFGALLYDIRPSAQLTVRSPSGETRQISVSRVTFDELNAIDTGTVRRPNFADAVTFERIGENAAYLRVDTFVNYRKPVDPSDIFVPIFKALRKEQRDHLILDLRNNGGGSTEPMRELFAHLTTEKARLVRDTRASTLDFDGLRDHLWTWDSSALNPNPRMFNQNDDGSYSLKSKRNEETRLIKPARNSFKGQIYALSSHSNSSGSAILLAKLRDMNRAIIVGEETGGSAEGPTAGIIFTLTLPESGIRTRVPGLRSYNDIAAFDHGKGIRPDVSADVTVSSYLNGEDPALDAARALIEQQPTPAAQ